MWCLGFGLGFKGFGAGGFGVWGVGRTRIFSEFLNFAEAFVIFAQAKLKLMIFPEICDFCENREF